MKQSNWCISNDSCVKNKLNYWESVFSLSNGYMGIRGVEDEIPAGSNPGLYIAGIFDKSECLISEIVNFPEIMMIRLEIDGQIISPETCTIEEYFRELDMATGTINRKIVYTTKSQKKVKIESRRFLSFYDLNCGANLTTITALNFSSHALVHTHFDASSLSREGSYFYDEQVKHYHVININDQFEADFQAKLQLRESGTFIEFASAFVCNGVNANFQGRRIHGETVNESLDIPLQKKAPVVVTKYFVIQDSREFKEQKLAQIANIKLSRMKWNGFNGELIRSNIILNQRWSQTNVVINGDNLADKGLRFNLFHLMCLGNEFSSQFAIGAKGLSSEHYGGHYFWDTEMYLIPFFLRTNIAVARNLLEFRVDTLSRAMHRAIEQGYKGCLWPWQSDERGEEGVRNTVYADGTIERRDILDQYHLVSDVAFACFQYLSQTGDEYYFSMRLSKIVVESLRFWQSFLIKNNSVSSEALHIPHVMGPDEYHKQFNDNFYTNFLTKWVFIAFFDYYENADEKRKYDLRTTNNISQDELNDLKLIGNRIHIPPLRDNVIEQFAGYFNLKDVIIDQWDDHGLPIYPDPSVGEGLPDAERQNAFLEDANHTQLTKQADALLPICVTPDQFPLETIQATFRYYAKRTLHFSSLSPGNYALAGALAGETKTAYHLFKLAMNMDLADIKNETATGLHTACQGATYLAVVMGFAGVQLREDCISLNPNLPEGWVSVEFPFQYHGARFFVRVEKERVILTMKSPGAVSVLFGGKKSVLRKQSKKDIIQFFMLTNKSDHAV